MTTALALIAVLLIVLANAFFVAAEYALVTVRRTRVQELADQGNKRARRVADLQTNPARFISAIQLGVTLSSLALGAIGEPVISQLARVAARPAARELARRRRADRLGDPRLHDPLVLPRGAGRDRAEDLHAAARRAGGAGRGRADRRLLHRVPAVHLGAGRGQRRGAALAGAAAGGAAHGGALRGGAEDAGRRQPRAGRARGGGAGDAPQGVRVRRQGRRRT